MTAKKSLQEVLRKLSEVSKYDLTKEEKRQLSGLFRKHSSIFQLDGKPLGRTDLIRHDIKTNSHPIRQPPWSFPIGLRKESEKQIAEKLENNVIEPSSSLWASPVV